MKAHIISINDFDGYDHKVILAKDGKVKELYLMVEVTGGELTCELRLRQGINITPLDINDFNFAIEQYNSI